jgi:hypothetical protein
MKLSVADMKLSLWNRKLSLADMKLSVADMKLSLWNRKLSVADMKLSLWNRKLSVTDMKLSFWNRKLSVLDLKLSVTVPEAFGHRTGSFRSPYRKLSVNVPKILIKKPESGSFAVRICGQLLT